MKVEYQRIKPMIFLIEWSMPSMRENLKQVMMEHCLEARLNLCLEWIISNSQLSAMAFHCQLLPNGDIRVGLINVLLPING